MSTCTHVVLRKTTETTTDGQPIWACKQCYAPFTIKEVEIVTERGRVREAVEKPKK